MACILWCPGALRVQKLLEPTEVTAVRVEGVVREASLGPAPREISIHGGVHLLVLLAFHPGIDGLY
jgi:hypothetical protein